MTKSGQCNIEWVAILIVIAIIYLSQFHIYSFSGTSLCRDDDCLIEPEDIILTRQTSTDELEQGDVLCTDDDICHVLTIKESDEFCTEGLNRFSLDKCYKWAEYETEVIWRIPHTFWRSASIAGVILFIALLICKSK